MRLTEILNALFESGGGDIYIGGTKLDGIVISKDSDSIVASTVASKIDSANLRITYDTNNPIIGTNARLVATAAIEFDSYEWSIDGTATFVGGINTGNTVFITDSELSNNIVTLTATAGDIAKIVQIPLNFVNGFFGDAKIVGVNTIDYTDPVKYSLVSTPMPDSVQWSISGDAILSSGGSIYETFVMIGESGEDVELSAIISKTGFIDKEIKLPIAVAKCEIASGGATVERPSILMDDGWTINQQGLLRVSKFHGINNPSIIEYQIDENGGIFDSPIISAQVQYSIEFSIDISTLQSGESYVVRVRFIDDIGNESGWSDPVSFNIANEQQAPYDSKLIEYTYSKAHIAYKLSKAGTIYDVFSRHNISPSSGVSVSQSGDNSQDVVDLSDGYMYNGSFQSINNNFFVLMKVYLNNYDNERMDLFAWKGDGESVSTNNNEFKTRRISDTEREIGYFTETGEGTNHDAWLGVSVPVEEWIYIGIKITTSAIDIYLNGTKIHSGSFTNSDSTTKNFYIGGPYNGRFKIEEFILWSKYLPGDQSINEMSNSPVSSHFVNIFESLSGYWSMNTQNPRDLINSNDFSTHYCQVAPNGTYDNFLRFNGSSSKITNAYSIKPGVNSFAVRVRFNSLSAYYPFILGQNVVFEFGIDHGELVAYSGDGSTWNSEVKTGWFPSTGVFYDIVVATMPGKMSFYVDGVLIYSANDNGIIGTNSGFMGIGKRDDNGLDFLDGDIEEVAVWEGYFIRDEDAVNWHNKQDRPFGGEQKYSLPCAAIDKPVILNDSGPSIKVTRYYGERDFAKAEYQIFRDVDLEFDNPVFQELVYEPEDIPINTSVADDTYKIRVRYKDINNNESQWSRIRFFNYIKNTYEIFDIFEDNSAIILANLYGDLSFQGDSSFIISQLGTSFYTTDKGSAVKLEGNNSYIKIESLPAINAFTMSLIVYYDSATTSNYPGLIGQVDTPIKSLRVSHAGNSSPNMWTNGGDNIISGINSTVYNGHWALWTLSYDGSKYTIDINNGEQYGDVSGDAFDTTKIVLGAQLETGEGIVGFIKQFRMFNRILTSDEKAKLLLEMGQF